MELTEILSQLGGGAGAAIVLTALIRKTFGIAERYRPATAVISGFVVALIIALGVSGGGVFSDPATFVVAFFAGLSAVGAHSTVQDIAS
tara:strand:- start:1885 stop:2151 length:267 start_codon:yes stop_codon:yes gene_type:complete